MNALDSQLNCELGPELPSNWTPSQPEGRWAKLGPYYAMFPVNFVQQAIARFCSKDGAILDPFCGRGTVPFVAKATGRKSMGIDINPVAYVFCSAKTDPAVSPRHLLKRIDEVASLIHESDCVPENEFQTWAWSSKVLSFLHSARRELDWKNSKIDRTLMAIILVNLHAKLGNGVSNQMRQTKSMAPDYSVRWWKERNMYPPDIDPVLYFKERVYWRYKKGLVSGPKAKVILGDARKILTNHQESNYEMLLTSPPYCGVTNYKYDNWIRLWMLGEPSLPSNSSAERYGNKEEYISLIYDVFSAAKNILKSDATIYVRTDKREFTRNTTQSVLCKLWPNHSMLVRDEVVMKSQTALFGDHRIKPGETDFLLLPKIKKIPDGFQHCN